MRVWDKRKKRPATPFGAAGQYQGGRYDRTDKEPLYPALEAGFTNTLLRAIDLVLAAAWKADTLGQDETPVEMAVLRGNVQVGTA
ncbi:hypothetical protein UFOVP1349_34 [uncultured Caudovirales phage]|uniref:Uncharacterized protein n=1 Tax=uncultured Caudovirales phage TaxID=2100421 RepID=A0A6J5PK95_9CAUD|nr:hypothetical protein UFOVP925_9 [uncultured Caudovirales phage]CAB4184259.1 hypothetical protein UFOVP1097_40 [uncultured Caudovirales phage]CAB4200222.1 hypothetical protein UFOVP1349_34 [uncultured Caudovirales phage]CAB4214081.1 hypothetical protein UFOVP1456_14 [uncultured Caudovirales phage]